MSFEQLVARAKDISTLINTVGVSTILLGLVLAWLFGWLSIPMFTRLADNVANLAAADMDMRKALVRIEERQQDGLRVLARAAKINCQNAAENLHEAAIRARALANCDTMFNFIQDR